jgi:hypothetical protein
LAPRCECMANDPAGATPRPDGRDAR